MEKPHIIKFSKIGEEEIGYLSVAENLKDLPFEVQRIYWVYGTPENIERGNHAHIEGRQVIVAINGTIEIILENQSGETFTFVLDTPSSGLYVPKMYWRKLHFKNGAVCVCFASNKYDPADYIYKYSDFKKA